MMNKIIKDYIEQADYNELFDIMECANNSILNLIAAKENPWEWAMYVVKAMTDYRGRLHLMPAPQEQYHYNCAYNNYEQIYKILNKEKKIVDYVHTFSKERRQINMP